ncbi:MAG: acyl-CoA thioesterase, partial [Candidatus Sericytochromatia bacterium]
MNEIFKRQIEIRWSDLDPNFHVRHSVYYDWGAYMRTVLMEKEGLTLKLMQEQNFGPVIFREECLFRK